MPSTHLFSSSNRRRIAGAVFLFLLPCFLAEAASKDIPYFSPVNDWCYRGGQPPEEAFAKLKQKGIRTVVNFRNEKDWIEWERKKVESLGMKYVSLPWSITRPVKSELLDQFFEVLDRPENRPVFFHCKHGRDRSGVMSMMALMHYEKLSEAQAHFQALEAIRPHLQYRPFVNQKVKFFLKERKNKISGSAELAPGG